MGFSLPTPTASAKSKQLRTDQHVKENLPDEERAASGLCQLMCLNPNQSAETKSYLPLQKLLKDESVTCSSEGYLKVVVLPE